jgi:hypothetical protein
MHTWTKLLAASCTAAAVVALSPGGASATPGKSPNWIALVGECDGVPTTILDPQGPGVTGFNTTTGKMGVGRLYEAINTATGETILIDEYGKALEHAHHASVTCQIPVPADQSPDGTTNWIFQVTGFAR